MNKERELLSRALEAWDDEFQNIDNASIFSEIRTYLSTTSDDAEEPVAWMFETDRGPHYFRTEKDALRGASLYGNYVFKPLYLHPPKPAEPARKPMTPKECSDGYMELEGVLGPDAHLISFLSGICVAQKHHDIGGDDE